MVTKQLNKHQTDVKEILLIFSIARRKKKFLLVVHFVITYPIHYPA